MQGKQLGYYHDPSRIYHQLRRYQQPVDRKRKGLARPGKGKCKLDEKDAGVEWGREGEGGVQRTTRNSAETPI